MAGESATLDRVELADPVVISDLHLSEATPRTLARFERFVATEAAAHRELVILGDLFDAWIGDDDLDSTVGRRVSAALAAATRGQRVFLMHGNRDVLVGTSFCAATGAQLLADPVHARIPGVEWLLSHGDAWCATDHAYQKFRARRASRLATRLSRATVEERIAIEARAVSEADKRTKSFEIMDVAPAAVESALRAVRARILHGHTHRPGVHHGELDGVAVERWVLPDWDFEAKKADLRGGYVTSPAAQPRPCRPDRPRTSATTRRTRRPAG